MLRIQGFFYELHRAADALSRLAKLMLEKRTPLFKPIIDAAKVDTGTSGVRATRTLQVCLPCMYNEISFHLRFILHVPSVFSSKRLFAKDHFAFL